MNMRWRKLGLVFQPDPTLSWSRSHAMVPTPIWMPNLGVLRVFYTACDAAGVGRPSYFDVDPADPTRVLYRHPTPVLDIGRPGTFDENGAVVTSVVHATDGRLYMYYVGFELGTRIRYRLLTGLATSDDGGASFMRTGEVPVLERSTEELFFRGGPFVLHDGARFRMWYVAGSDWIDLNGKPMPEYRVKYLESTDGISWGPAGRLVLDITGHDEHGFGRPWILRGPQGYAMFYSVRRKSLAAYRMGYAESNDGLAWDRQDSRLGLDAGPEPYDDMAAMYAAPIELDGRLWCFYNGNEFGREGVLLAVREEA
jgi:hypothetical protein